MEHVSEVISRVLGKLANGEPLEHPHLCDECGKARNRGNHQACSKARQLKRQGGVGNE